MKKLLTLLLTLCLMAVPFASLAEEGEEMDLVLEGFVTEILDEGFVMEDTELVAICDIRPERMEPYPDKRHYIDFDEMLQNEELDILDICLPTYLHAVFAIKAMERGIHVICEKPIPAECALHPCGVASIY